MFGLGTLTRVLGEVRADVSAARDRDPAARTASTPEILATWGGVQAILTHRIAHALYEAEVPMVPRVLANASRIVTGVEIHPAATIGNDIFIDHGSGVVIGETAEIGCCVTIYQGVTLGGTGFQRGKRHPTVEDNVTIGSGAKLLGPIQVGHGAGADRDVVLDRRVALAALKARAAQRHALVDRHAAADLGRLADDDAGAVVDEGVVADLGRRVDLDPGHDSRGIGQDPGHHRHLGLVQSVGDAVGENGLDASPGRQDLRRRGGARCGIAIARGADVGANLAEDPREGAETEHAESIGRCVGRGPGPKGADSRDAGRGRPA